MHVLCGNDRHLLSCPEKTSQPWTYCQPSLCSNTLTPALFALQLYISGMGYAQLPGVAASTNINYGMSIASITPAVGSIFGGTNVTLLGFGFTPSLNTSALGRTMIMNFTTAPYTGLNFTINFANATMIQVCDGLLSITHTHTDMALQGP